MAGLGPVIHIISFRIRVDARNKSGHDERSSEPNDRELLSPEYDPQSVAERVPFIQELTPRDGPIPQFY